MPSQASCRKCGAALDGPRGNCPACLMQALLPNDRGSIPQDSMLDYDSFPRAFGDFILEASVGRGGMGMVYRGRQVGLNRVVAIKMLVGGGFAGPEALKRFQSEAEATAQLRHPNLVTLYGAGEHEGLPFYSMEYVEGRDLAQWIQEGAVTPRQAAEWVQAAAEGIQHAHEHGILHRDLKPSNILIDPFGQPRVTDFGLAMQTGSDSNLTVTGQAVGSPSYMPPEQARGAHKEMGTHSDVYSLGAVLYHLLTGRPPFMGESIAAVLAQVESMDPVRPRNLNPGVPLDLETICLKCLEKSPDKRYPEARSFSDELKRFLGGEPIHARRSGLLERTWKWCRRRPAVAALLTALTLALASGTWGVVTQWQRAEAQRVQAEANEFRALQNEYAADMRAASEAIERGDLAEGRRLLRRHDGSEESRLKPGDAMQGFEWPFLMHRAQGHELAVLAGHESTVCSVAVSPDNLLAASGAMDSSLRIWHINSRAEHARIPITTVGWFVAFARDGRHLLAPISNGKVALFEIETRTPIRQWPGRLGVVCETKPWLVLSTASPWPDSPDGDISIWNYETGDKMQALPLKGKRTAISKDGRTLAVATRGFVILWDLEAHAEGLRIPYRPGVWGMDFSPDGGYLAIAGMDRQLRLCDLKATPREPTSGRSPEPRLIESPARTGRLLDDGHSLNLWAVAFHPDDGSLLSASSDRSLRLWSTPELSPRHVWLGHHDEVWCATFFHEGRSVLSAGKDGKLMIWTNQPPEATPHVRNDTWGPPRISPDGRLMIGTVYSNRTFHTSVKRIEGLIADEVSWKSYALYDGFSADGTACYSLPLEDGAIRVRQRSSPNDETLIRLEGFQAGSSLIRQGRGLPPGGRFAYAITSAGKFTLWTLPDGRQHRSWNTSLTNISCSALSSDGERWAIGLHFPYSAHLFDTRTGASIELKGHTEYVKDVAFSADGRLLATAGVDAKIRLWDTKTGILQGTLIGHLQEVSSLAFAPDGRTLASIETRTCLKLWRLDSMREVVSIQDPQFSGFLAFLPGNRGLAVRMEDQTVHLLFATGNRP